MEIKACIERYCPYVKKNVVYDVVNIQCVNKYSSCEHYEICKMKYGGCHNDWFLNNHIDTVP